MCLSSHRTATIVVSFIPLGARVIVARRTGEYAVANLWSSAEDNINGPDPTFNVQRLTFNIHSTRGCWRPLYLSILPSIDNINSPSKTGESLIFTSSKSITFTMCGARSSLPLGNCPTHSRKLRKVTSRMFSHRASGHPHCRRHGLSQTSCCGQVSSLMSRSSRDSPQKPRRGPLRPLGAVDRC